MPGETGFFIGYGHLARTLFSGLERFAWKRVMVRLIQIKRLKSEQFCTDGLIG
jgi:hypothetical protein